MISPPLRATFTVVSAVLGLYARAELQAGNLNTSQLEARVQRLEARLVSQELAENPDSIGESYFYPDPTPVTDDIDADPVSLVDYCQPANCRRGHIYGEVQFVFARAHVTEGALGPTNSKLSEEYELAPRVILAAENNCCNGVRARYWHYGHHLNDLANPGGFRFEFDVFDFEAYHRFRGKRTDLTIGGGFRAAQIGIDYNGGWNDVTGLGLTLALDGETLVCCRNSHYLSFVYGGRVAMLGGDWSGTETAVPARRDDNIIVGEFNVGLEHGCRVWASDLYWRLAFEMQNWQSDVLSSGTNADSISFVGPGFQLGASY